MSYLLTPLWSWQYIMISTFINWQSTSVLIVSHDKQHGMISKVQIGFKVWATRHLLTPNCHSIFKLWIRHTSLSYVLNQPSRSYDPNLVDYNNIMMHGCTRCLKNLGTCAETNGIIHLQNESVFTLPPFFCYYCWRLFGKCTASIVLTLDSSKSRHF